MPRHLQVKPGFTLPTFGVQSAGNMVIAPNFVKSRLVKSLMSHHIAGQHHLNHRGGIKPNKGGGFVPRVAGRTPLARESVGWKPAWCVTIVGTTTPPISVIALKGESRNRARGVQVPQNRPKDSFMTNRHKDTLCKHTQPHGTRWSPLIMRRHHRAKAKVKDQVIPMPNITWGCNRPLLVPRRRRLTQTRLFLKMPDMTVQTPVALQPRGPLHQLPTPPFIKV
jgi:hypothetical protein